MVARRPRRQPVPWVGDGKGSHKFFLGCWIQLAPAVPLPTCLLLKTEPVHHRRSTRGTQTQRKNPSRPRKAGGSWPQPQERARAPPTSAQVPLLNSGSAFPEPEGSVYSQGFRSESHPRGARTALFLAAPLLLPVLTQAFVAGAEKMDFEGLPAC